MYYALIMLSVIMFGGCFAVNENYGKRQGSGIKKSLEFSLISSIAGIFVLFVTGGFKFSLTPFTLIMALATALNGLGFTFCSFKAFKSINLSLYSLYSMLGGMLLPFFQGILFFGEKVTVAKLLCLVFVAAALILTVEKKDKKGGAIYYIGVFVLNGMSGVLSKIFASANYPKTDAASFSILSALCSVVISALLLLMFFRKDETQKQTPITITLGALSGSLNRIANYILILALSFVDASVQYPMVTGGTIIVSTIICFIKQNKPSIKEILSVILAFVGMVLLFVVPI